MRLIPLVLLLAALSPAPALAASGGSLAQLPGRAGCFIDPTYGLPQSGCAKARGLASTQNVALSPDGRNLYAASNFSWGLDAFARSAATGRLRQLPGKAGCFTSHTPSGTCTPARGLVWALWVAVSPDGRNVYASGGIGNAIAVFHRDAKDGSLVQLPGPAGCVRNRTGGTTQGGPPASASGCTLVDNLVYPRTVTLSPDGRFLYAAAFDGRTITSFARNPQTGALTPTGCVAQAAKPGCGDASTLAGVTDLTIAADGRHLYATAYKGDAVLAFARDPQTGALTQTACLAGRTVAGCTRARALRGAYNLALAPGGRQLYVAARGGSLALANVDPASGALRQPAGRTGCVAMGAASGCGRARGLKGARGVTVSPDGRTVYAGAFSSSALTTFARDTKTGALRQLGGGAGCLGAAASAGCRRGRAVRHAWGIAVSRDGRFVYTGVAGDGNSGLGVFGRTRP